MKGKRLSEDQKEEIISLMRSVGAVVGYLFGSYARGTAGPLSDIDVGVIFPHSMKIEEQELRIEEIRNGLEMKYGGRDKADVVNVSVVRSPLLRYIITLGEGVVLFSDEETLRNRLTDFARRDYEDTKSLRVIQRQALSHLFA
jgi:predicted nucleotidyltransferase